MPNIISMMLKDTWRHSGTIKSLFEPIVTRELGGSKLEVV